MERQFFVALWILWLPQQILCRPPAETAVDSPNVHADTDSSDSDQIEENGGLVDGEWLDDELDMPYEHQHSEEYSGENTGPEKVTSEEPDNQTNAISGTPKEFSSKEENLPETETPISLSKRLEASSLDEQQKQDENGKDSPDTSSELVDKAEKGSAVGSAEERERESSIGLEKETSLEVAKGSKKKGPKQPESKESSNPSNRANKPEEKIPKSKEPKKKGSTSPAQVTPAEKSKWQAVRNQLNIPADHKNLDKSKRQPLADIKNIEQTKPQKRTPEPSKQATKPNRNRVELVGNMSDLLSTVGQRINNSLDGINKKPGSRLKRSVPADGATKALGPNRGKKSAPKITKPSSLTSSPLRNEGELGSKSKTSRASSKRDLLVAHEPGVDTMKEKSGMEDYEKLMAQRAKQLDEFEEEKRPMMVKQLPKRLGSVSGDFGTIANLLGNNIKSVSAVNKDMISRRGLALKTPLEVVPLTRRGGPLDDADDSEYADDTAVKKRGDKCECYNKYSAFNVVRRTAKRVVRAVRHGTNRLYEGVDFTIAKSKDLKDALKADIVDPAVQLIPLVGPAVGAVVDTGDAISDTAIGGARAVVQGGQQLNDGVLSGVEGVLKKDKTCRCAETRGAEQEEDLTY